MITFITQSQILWTVKDFKNIDGEWENADNQNVSLSIIFF